MTLDDAEAPPLPEDPLPAPDDGNALIPLSLDEFCARFSRREKRGELLGAFHFWMKRQGVTFAIEPEFLTYFAVFTGTE